MAGVGLHTLDPFYSLLKSKHKLRIVCTKKNLISGRSKKKVNNLLLNEANNNNIICKLANLDEIVVITGPLPTETIQGVIEGVSFGLSIVSEIDVEKERVRLEKELKKVSEDIENIIKKLSNEKFLQKAPEKVILENRNRLSNAEDKKSKLRMAKSRLNTIDS